MRPQIAGGNPRQARRFSEGTGTMAKTDRVDATMLAKMGSLLELQADQLKGEMPYNLKGMTTDRQALIKDRTAARARLATATYPLLRKQATLRLRQIERDNEQIDATIETLITSDKTLSEKADILISIPGIAPSRAFSMPCQATDNRFCDADRNPRAGQSQRKASREPGRPCPNFTPIPFSVMQASPVRQWANGRAKRASKAGGPVCEERSTYLPWSPRASMQK